LQAGLDSMHKKRVLARQRKQMVNFQAIVKGAQVRQRVRKMRAGVMDIARVFRGSRIRQRDQKHVAASVVIGASVRGWLTRLRFQRVKQSIATLQVAWRKALMQVHTREQAAAATRIATAWKACSYRRHYKRVRDAGALLVSATFMWKHIRIKKYKLATATRVGAAWRGYCVRKNLVALRRSANTICEWWRNRKAKGDIMWTLFEIGCAKMRVRNEYSEPYAILIQRNFRRWLRWRRGMHLIKRMVLSMQSRYRSWGPKQDVDRLRAEMGPHVKRLPAQLVALIPDKRKKFTRYRAFRQKERICPHVARIVRLKVLPPDFRDDLSDVVGKIQAFLRYRLYLARSRSCQRVVRGWLVRRQMQRRKVAAQQIQCAVRRMLARKHPAVRNTELRRKRHAAIVIQAHLRGFFVRTQTRKKEKETMPATEKDIPTLVG